MNHISYQLYCSRNFPPLLDVCRMLAAAGYKEVEGYRGLFDDLDGVKSALAETGLTMSSCHIGLDVIQNDPKLVLDLAAAVGMKKVFIPFLAQEDRPSDSEGWKVLSAQAFEAAKPLKDAGLGFGWHNHEFEFVATPQGDLPNDLIADAGIDLELDVGWVVRAGQDPVSTINRYGEKVIAAHIKDIAPAGECVDEDGWADVGHGVIDWAGIHAALQSAGCDHYVIEHDNPSDHKRFAERSLASVQNF